MSNNGKSGKYKDCTNCQDGKVSGMDCMECGGSGKVSNTSYTVDEFEILDNYFLDNAHNYENNMFFYDWVRENEHICIDVLSSFELAASRNSEATNKRLTL